MASSGDRAADCFWLRPGGILEHFRTGLRQAISLAQNFYPTLPARFVIESTSMNFSHGLLPLLLVRRYYRTAPCRCSTARISQRAPR